MISLKPESKKERKKEPKGPVIFGHPKHHFTTDGKRRYCTGRPKGKDELVANWDEVDCGKCLLQNQADNLLEMALHKKQ